MLKPLGQDILFSCAQQSLWEPWSPHYHNAHCSCIILQVLTVPESVVTSWWHASAEEHQCIADDTWGQWDDTYPICSWPCCSWRGKVLLSRCSPEHYFMFVLQEAEKAPKGQSPSPHWGRMEQKRHVPLRQQRWYTSYCRKAWKDLCPLSLASYLITINLSILTFSSANRHHHCWRRELMKGVSQGRLSQRVRFMYVLSFL